MDSMETTSRIYVAGHRGLVGSAIVRAPRSLAGYQQSGGADAPADGPQGPRRSRPVLLRGKSPNMCFWRPPEWVASWPTVPAPPSFFTTTWPSRLNVIDAAWRHGVKKLEFLGSSCIYPKHAEQPIREEALLTGPLEPTNEWYALAKIAGIKQCQAYRRQYGFRAISLMPTNLYGPGDNFDLETSHVLPALIRKFHDAKEQGAAAVTMWGTGSPLREFLHVDDLAAAAVHLMQIYDDEGIVNVGTGEDLTIRELAQLVAEVVGYQGRLEFDTSKPDGTMRKLLDVSKLRGLGWTPTIKLREGIQQVYAWYVRQNIAKRGLSTSIVFNLQPHSPPAPLC